MSAALHVVLTTCGAADAEPLADALVRGRLAACVSVIPGIVSTYRWQGSVTREQEHLLLIKVAQPDLPALMAALPDLHPYDTPELVCLPAGHVGAPYLAWARAQTGAAPADPAVAVRAR